MNYYHVDDAAASLTAPTCPLASLRQVENADPLAWSTNNRVSTDQTSALIVDEDSESRVSTQIFQSKTSH